MKNKSSWLSRLCAFVLAVAFVVAVAGCSQSTSGGTRDSQSPACKATKCDKPCPEARKKECEKSSKAHSKAAAKETAKEAGETK